MECLDEPWSAQFDRNSLKRMNGVNAKQKDCVGWSGRLGRLGSSSEPDSPLSVVFLAPGREAPASSQDAGPVVSRLASTSQTLPTSGTLCG